MPSGQPSDLERLDLVLVARGLAPTRVKARALVLAGQVSSAGVRLDKPGARVSPAIPLEIQPGRRWVSRGGEKLVVALQEFAVDPAGRDAMDIGASTGGFTQVLLEAGALRVLAVDVGRGQLDWTLRKDDRVQPLEGVNARYLDPRRLPYRPALAVIDVSFISLRLVLPAVTACLAPQGEIVALVKPQFEVGRRAVGRGGIVRDRALHRRVLADIAGLALERKWGPQDLRAAAVRGAEGNQEYFIHLRPNAPGPALDELDRRIRAVTQSDTETAS